MSLYDLFFMYEPTYRKGMRNLQVRTNGSRENITVLAAVCADGRALPPHILVKGKTQRSLASLRKEEAPAGTSFVPSDSGWMKRVSIAFSTGLTIHCTRNFGLNADILFLGNYA